MSQHIFTFSSDSDLLSLFVKFILPTLGKQSFSAARRTNLDKVFLRVAAIKLNLQDQVQRPHSILYFTLIFLLSREFQGSLDFQKRMNFWESFKGGLFAKIFIANFPLYLGNIYVVSRPLDDLCICIWISVMIIQLVVVTQYRRM